MTTEIRKSEIRKPKTPEEKALEDVKNELNYQKALAEDIKTKLDEHKLLIDDQKALIHHLNNLLPKLYEAFDNIPAEVLKAFATKLEFSLNQSVKLEDGSTVEITNLNALADAVQLLSTEFKAWQAKDSITVKNLKELKPDLTNVDKTISKLEEVIRQFIAKDVNVIVNGKDEVSINNWPKKPSEAIPVVLVDKELKKFYNSVATFMGGGGGSFVQGPIKFKINGEDTIVDAAHPLPVSIVGDVIITGDVIVDQVGVENIAGVKINPATAENQQTDALTDVELRATPVPVSGTITLDAATLAALETINAIVTGTIALDAPTLAALENIIVTGTVALDAPTLAALENITAVVTGEVSLDAATLAALETINAVVSGTVETKIVDTAGGAVAEVNTRTDGIVALEVADDMTSCEIFRQALVASTDTTITFSQPVRLVRVKNESLTSTIFVRDGAIISDTPDNAEMVGVAPLANLPTTEYYPFKTTTVHLRSAGTPTVSIIGVY